jgi:hypothetical protein
MDSTKPGPRRAWRSRWAALGAAVAVTLGAGGIVAVNAASSSPSAFVAIDPLVRILDTRTNVGLVGPFASEVARTLQVTGNVPTQPPNNAPQVNAVVVPAGATSVVLNVTVIGPQTNGFVSIRPGTAIGFPGTSNQNFVANGQNIANSVTVQLPADGTINIFVQGTVRAVALDVAGFYSPVGPPRYFGISGGKTQPVDIASTANGNPNQITEIDVPAGTYRVAAKLTADYTKSSSGGLDTLTCFISNKFPGLRDAVQAETFDSTSWLAEYPRDANPNASGVTTLSMLSLVTFPTAGKVDLSCSPGQGEFDITFFTIDAIEVTP